MSEETFNKLVEQFIAVVPGSVAQAERSAKAIVGALEAHVRDIMTSGSDAGTAREPRPDTSSRRESP